MARHLSDTPRVIFAAHGAERTGPPVYLLHVLRWLRANTNIELEVVLLEGGELEDDLRALAPVTVLGQPEARPHWAALEWCIARVGWTRGAERLRWLVRAWRLRKVHGTVGYVNTAGSAEALRYVWPRPRVVVTHVHEMAIGLDFHLSPAADRFLRDHTDQYLSVAEVVTDAVVQHFGVDRDAVHRHPGVVVVPEVVPVPVRAPGVPSGALVVGASGLTHWRKGPDLFVQLAAAVEALAPGLGVHFVWVGGEVDGAEVWPWRFDVERLGLGGRVHFVGHQREPLGWYGAFDVFVLTSREDAFPLVCLEAASVGVPVVCFDSGGMPEFVGEECGVVVRYPEVEVMAERVVGLLVDGELRARFGAAGALRVRERHDVEVAAPALWEELRPWLDT